MNFSTNSIRWSGKQAITKAAYVFCCVFLACMALPYSSKSQTFKSLYLTRDSLFYVLKKVKKDKIVFQFFVNKSGVVVLYAWPKWNDGDHNDKTDGVKLDTVKGDSTLSTAGNDYLLTNLQIGKKEINTLRDSKHKYFIFKPFYELIDTIKIFHIFYKIYGTDIDPGTGEGYDLKTLSFLATTKNPSPPK